MYFLRPWIFYVSIILTRTISVARCRMLFIAPKNVRAVCIRATDLTSQRDAEQLSMFVDNERRDRRERLEDAVEEVRRRYGKKSLTYAVLMGNLKMPNDGRDIVRMPSPMYQ